MTDIRKKFYHTRVQLYLADMLTLADDCVIVALPRRGLYMVKNLLQYAGRRVQWVQTIVSDDEFNAPDDTNWDLIQAILAETEGCLMTTCDVSGITTQLACICNALKQTLGTSVAPLPTMRDETVASVFEYSSTQQDTDFVGISDETACKTAQLYYALGCETITEIVLPASRFAFDSLVPAVAALIVVVTGGIGLPAAVGVYLTVELIQELFEFGYDASESNLENWLLSVKEEIICHAYWLLYAGQPASVVAQSVYDNVIAPSSSISAGDKLICKLFFDTWVLTNANIARVQNTTWAQENVVVDYCAICQVTGDYVWTFPPCLNGWTGDSVGCCDPSDNIRMPQTFSNWYNNVSPAFSEPLLGTYKTTYQCMIFVDYDEWDFYPDPNAKVLQMGVRNMTTSQIQSMVNLRADELVSPGWNYVLRVDPECNFYNVADRQMTCAHKETNALCYGIRIAALAVTFDLLE